MLHSRRIRSRGVAIPSSEQQPPADSHACSRGVPFLIQGFGVDPCPDSVKDLWRASPSHLFSASSDSPPRHRRHRAAPHKASAPTAALPCPAASRLFPPQVSNEPEPVASSCPLRHGRSSTGRISPFVTAPPGRRRVSASPAISTPRSEKSLPDPSFARSPMPRAPSSSDGITATDPRRPRRGPAAIPISCDLHGGSNSDFAGLTRPDGLVIGFQRVADHRPPRWPEETAARRVVCVSVRVEHGAGPPGYRASTPHTDRGGIPTDVPS